MRTFNIQKLEIFNDLKMDCLSICLMAVRYRVNYLHFFNHTILIYSFFGKINVRLLTEIIPTFILFLLRPHVRFKLYFFSLKTSPFRSFKNHFFYFSRFLQTSLSFAIVLLTNYANIFMFLLSYLVQY